MVTSQQIREFARECLHWSEETEDLGQRDIMIRLAKTRVNAANRIDAHIAAGREVSADLRQMLD